jgi:hypothetical protein
VPRAQPENLHEHFHGEEKRKHLIGKFKVVNVLYGQSQRRNVGIGKGPYRVRDDQPPLQGWGHAVVLD